MVKSDQVFLLEQSSTKSFFSRFFLAMQQKLSNALYARTDDHGAADYSEFYPECRKTQVGLLPFRNMQSQSIDFRL